MQRFHPQRWLKQNWKVIVAGLVLFIVFIGLCFLQLNKLFTGIHPLEAEALARYTAFRTIATTPVDGVYFSIAKLIGLLTDASAIMQLKYASATAGFVGIGLFAWGLRKMRGTLTAMIGSIVLATSSWFLLYARLGTPLSMYLLWGGAVCTLSVYLYRQTKVQAASVGLAATLACALYTPLAYLAILPVIAYMVLERQKLTEQVSIRTFMVAGGLSSVLVTPLLIGLLTDARAISKALIGWPSDFPTITEFAKRIVELLATPFVSAPYNPALHIGRQQLLDIFTTVCIVLGASLLIKRLSRNALITASAGIVVFLVAISLQVQYQALLSIFIVPLYILAAHGIHELLRQWFTVFPRNPFARAIGQVLLLMVVSMAAFYHFTRYFIVRPNMPEVKAVYQSDTIE